MQSLHSYWRMPYVEAPKPEDDPGNPFVDIPKAEDERAALLLYRGEFNYIVLNKYPYNAGHLLVVPYREIGELSLLTKEERVDLMEMTVKAQDILTKAIKPQGFNIGYNFGRAAGAGIPTHLHCHVIPRWNGDTNFMPVIGDTRVLPASLDMMWERLKKFVD